MAAYKYHIVFTIIGKGQHATNHDTNLDTDEVGFDKLIEEFKASAALDHRVHPANIFPLSIEYGDECLWTPDCDGVDFDEEVEKRQHEVDLEKGANDPNKPLPPTLQDIRELPLEALHQMIDVFKDTNLKGVAKGKDVAKLRKTIGKKFFPDEDWS